MLQFTCLQFKLFQTLSRPHFLKSSQFLKIIVNRFITVYGIYNIRSIIMSGYQLYLVSNFMVANIRRTESVQSTNTILFKMINTRNQLNFYKYLKLIVLCFSMIMSLRFKYLRYLFLPFNGHTRFAGNSVLLI